MKQHLQQRQEIKRGAYLGFLVVLEDLVPSVKDEQPPFPGLDSPSLLHQISRLVVRLVRLRGDNVAMTSREITPTVDRKKFFY